MINQSKPTQGNPEYNLNIGDGFGLLIGGLYQLIISPLTGGSITNQTKVSIGETWGTIATTWATETQTWEEASQLISNFTKASSSIVNQAKP